MGTNALYPAFLTPEIAESSINLTLAACLHVLKPEARDLRELNCHFVVLVPTMVCGDEQCGGVWFPDFEIKPRVLCEVTFGEERREMWSHKYDEIARSKTMQLWHGRNLGETDISPHLLFPEDTYYWGGVYRHGIVVAGSGFKSYQDKMCSGMSADMMVYRAYGTYLKWRKENPYEDFIPYFSEQDED
jgi:hypothetical protein